MPRHQATNPPRARSPLPGLRKDPDPDKVPAEGKGSWQSEECNAVEGIVYLEHVKDDRGNDFFVLFKVLAVDKDSRYVAFVWRQLPGGKVVRRP